MKRLLKSLVRRFGYDISQRVDIPEHPFNALEYVVRAHLEEDDRFFVLQIGANDGVTDDPIHDLIVRHRLPGLLIEPLPDVFARLRQTYAGQPGLLFEECAVADHDGEVQLYRVDPASGASPWFQGYSSLRRGHLSAANLSSGQFADRVIALTVRCTTIPSLLKRHAIEHVSLLQVDTEGFDCAIVQMALQSGLRPRIINYEFVHASPTERAVCKRLLSTLGYRYIDVGMDTLAVYDAANAA